MVDRGIPRNGYEIFDAKQNAIGIVTSGTMSPSLGIGIGMGYVKWDYHRLDSEIYIQIRNNQLKAVVTKPPFIK